MSGAKALSTFGVPGMSTVSSNTVETIAWASENSPWPIAWSMTLCSAADNSEVLAAMKASWHVKQPARSVCVGFVSQAVSVAPLQVTLPNAFTRPLPPQAIVLARVAEAPAPKTITKVSTPEAASVGTIRW